MGRCDKHSLWVRPSADFLPHELARTIEALVDQGVIAMKRTLERAEAA
jgi:DNA polymerase IIIc chi subunit